MKVLAIDTASNVASAAILEDDKLLGEIILNHKLTHSQKLMPMIDALFQNCECKPEDMDLFAAANGPGSFTGLRIGVATVKGLAHGVNKPVIGISTLDGLAYSLPYCENLIVPIMDARRSQVYTGTYIWDTDGFKTVEEPRAVSIEECVSDCGNFLETVFVGDGVPVHREYICEKLGDKALFVEANANMQRASSIGALALRRYDRAVAPQELLPFYLRKSQAEREYDEKHFSKQ